MFKRFLAVLLFLGLSFPVIAKTPTNYIAISKDGSTIITITSEPCTGKVAKMVKPEYLKVLKKAKVVYNKQELEACWMITEKGGVGVIDETGDSGEISPNYFVPVKEV